MPSLANKDAPSIPWTFNKSIAQTTARVELVNCSMAESKVYYNMEEGQATPKKPAKKSRTSGLQSLPSISEDLIPQITLPNGETREVLWIDDMLRAIDHPFKELEASKNTVTARKEQHVKSMGIAMALCFCFNCMLQGPKGKPIKDWSKARVEIQNAMKGVLVSTPVAAEAEETAGAILAGMMSVLDDANPDTDAAEACDTFASAHEDELKEMLTLMSEFRDAKRLKTLSAYHKIYVRSCDNNKVVDTPTIDSLLKAVGGSLFEVFRPIFFEYALLASDAVQSKCMVPESATVYFKDATAIKDFLGLRATITTQLISDALSPYGLFGAEGSAKLLPNIDPFLFLSALSSDKFALIAEALDAIAKDGETWHAVWAELLNRVATVVKFKKSFDSISVDSIVKDMDIFKKVNAENAAHSIAKAEQQKDAEGTEATLVVAPPSMNLYKVMNFEDSMFRNGSLCCPHSALVLSCKVQRPDRRFRFLRF